MRAVVAIALLAACERPPKRVPDELPTAVAVDADHALLKTGAVGTAEKQETTYVLVDVKNNSDRDRMIAVDGTLVDEGGREVGKLRHDQMRVPRQGIRTFALVSPRPVTGAARVAYHVVRAEALDHPAEIDIEEPSTSRQGEAFVASAWAKNREKRTASAVVAATFYGPDGKILARPFTIVKIPPGERRPVRFEGPKEATEAALFVGEMVFD